MSSDSLRPEMRRGTPWDPRFAERHVGFAPLAAAAGPFTRFEDFPPVASWNDALGARAPTNAAGAPLRFVAATHTPRRRPDAPIDLDAIYDVRIDTRGEVSSRERSWHDLLNALCWATFPRAKAALSARQHVALRAWIPPGARRLPGVRSRERDALAMLDEGALLLLVRAAAADLIRAALIDCDEPGVERAVGRGDARALLFGHAMYEHLVCGTGAVRALPICVVAPSIPDDLAERIALVDTALAARLGDPTQFTAPPDLRALVVTPALVAR